MLLSAYHPLAIAKMAQAMSPVLCDPRIYDPWRAKRSESFSPDYAILRIVFRRNGLPASEASQMNSRGVPRHEREFLEKSCQLTTLGKGHLFPGDLEIGDFKSPKELDCELRNLITLSGVDTEDLRYSGKRR